MNVVGQVLLLYSFDWAHTGMSFIFLTVNIFHHSTLIVVCYSLIAMF